MGGQINKQPRQSLANQGNSPLKPLNLSRKGIILASLLNLDATEQNAAKEALAVWWVGQSIEKFKKLNKLFTEAAKGLPFCFLKRFLKWGIDSFYPRFLYL